MLCTGSSIQVHAYYQKWKVDQIFNYSKLCVRNTMETNDVQQTSILQVILHYPVQTETHKLNT